MTKLKAVRGIAYRTVEMEFEDRDHAKLWVLRNQLGRRNLSDFQFKLLVGQEHELMKSIDPPNPTGRNQYSEVKAQNELQPKSTAETLAKEHGVSRETVKRSADLYTSVKTIGEVAPEVALLMPCSSAIFSAVFWGSEIKGSL